LAQVIAQHTKSRFRVLNATSSGTKEVRELLEQARRDLELHGERTILFIDEIHRFNKTQQDVLLPDVEDGVVTLIGATTENPFFSINSPLVSRSQIFTFEPLTREHIKTIMHDIADLNADLATFRQHASTPRVSGEMSDGDASSFDRFGNRVKSSTTEPVEYTLEVAQDSIQRKLLNFDPTGDTHYDTAHSSKHTRRRRTRRSIGSPACSGWRGPQLSRANRDPGERRRRQRGPAGASVATAAARGRVRRPAGRSESGLSGDLLATAPKSNSDDGDRRERRCEKGPIPVPKHLRDSHYKGAKQFGHGVGYHYAHDGEGGFVAQDYLGVDKTYYEPTDRGYEAEIKKRMEEWKGGRRRKGGG
jgi:putative ATPase